MNIGIVDLDTSHPAAWIPIEREMGHKVVGVWDGGTVHPRAYVERFAQEKRIPLVFESLEDMAAKVDCAVIHGCDWDTHVDKARPFIEAGKAILIDKPMAGNARDLNQFIQWAEQGARIGGGSSLRFCPEVALWLAQEPEKRGSPHTALCGCGVDEFNYGVHAYALLSAIMGPGIVSVRHLAQKPQRRVQVSWNDGRIGILAVGATPEPLPFYAFVTTELGVHQFVVDNRRLYRSFLAKLLPYLGGDAAEPPVPIISLVEPERAAIAARLSWTSGDREVRLSDVPAGDPGYDGAEFAAGYKAARYPPKVR